jgi:FixJ family two-component response regulator
VKKRDVVLIVDDDPTFSRGLERLLDVHGLDADVFQSAEALHNRVGDRDPLCLLLDIDLGGACGIELRRQLTSSGVSTPVIFMTGKDSDMVHKAAVASGCVAYLLKPFTGVALMNAIQSVPRTA